jgi:molecular chaperone GrpE
MDDVKRDVADEVRADQEAPEGEAEPTPSAGTEAGDEVPGSSEPAGEGETNEQPGPDWQAIAEERYQQILRLRADFENFRRRVDREREELQGLVAAEIFGRLLTVYDNLDRALKSIPDSPDAAAWRTGIAMTQKSFLDVLKSQGVEPVPTVGQPFDPAIHEAILRAPDPAPDGTVVEELQAGFRWRDRVIRAALVKVSSGPEPAETAEQ